MRRLILVCLFFVSISTQMSAYRQASDEYIDSLFNKVGMADSINYGVSLLFDTNEDALNHVFNVVELVNHEISSLPGIYGNGSMSSNFFRRCYMIHSMSIYANSALFEMASSGNLSDELIEKFIELNILSNKDLPSEFMRCIHLYEHGKITKNEKLIYDFDEIKGCLNDDEVIIQYVVSRETKIGAFIVNSQAAPVFVEFPQEHSQAILFDALIFDSQEYVNSVDFSENPLIASVYDYLKNKKRIYVVSGNLPCAFSFNECKIPNGDSLRIIDRHEVLYLSSMDRLVSLKMHGDIKPTYAVLVGDIDYRENALNDELYISHSATDTLLMQREAAAIAQRKRRMRSVRDRYIDSALCRGLSIRPLTHSFYEINKVGELLKNNNVAVKTFMGKDATESIMNEIQDFPPGVRGVLHISSHAFSSYKSNYCNQLPEESFDVRTEAYLYDLSNFCISQFIFFSGADAQWKMRERLENGNPVSRPGVNDGILNALELYSLSLSPIDLVVLSTCNTMNGPLFRYARPSAFVWGFEAAGVRSILLSLWEVDDRSTAQLMVEFYNNWLAGYTRHEALRLAQLKIREQYPDPYYWAGFIIMN